jgi:hypothetical protein
MKTTTGKENVLNVEVVIDSDGAINSEGVFHDNEMVIDFLNSLLTSAPPTNLDFGEIRFVPQTHEDKQQGVGAQSTVIDGVRSFEAERALMEATAFKNENESLKLKIARLIAQVNEFECNLEVVVAENSELKSRESQLRNELAIVKKMSSPPPASLEPIEDKQPGAESDQPPDQIVPHEITGEVCEWKVVPEPEPESAAQESMAPCGEEVSQPPIIAPQENRPEYGAGSGAALDRVSISQPLQANDRVHRTTEPPTYIFSQKRHVIESPVQRANPSSKIIKRHQTGKNQNGEEITRVLDVKPRQPVQEERTGAKTEAQQAPDHQHQAPDAETSQKADQSSQDDLLRHGNVDITDLKPAPAPKVIVRLHVKNYETLQKEADATNPDAGHDVHS